MVLQAIGQVSQWLCRAIRAICLARAIRQARAIRLARAVREVRQARHSRLGCGTGASLGSEPMVESFRGEWRWQSQRADGKII